MRQQDITPVGTAKGPGELPQEFVFISPDLDQRLKAGEFVYYVDPADPEARPIFGRIANRQPVRLYPDDFLANPRVPPKEVAELFGYEGEAELFEIQVRALGYFDKQLKAFVNPRISPRVGWPIYLATDPMLSDVLNKSSRGAVGCVHVGSLLSRSGGAVPVVLAARDFTSTHLAILASTGAGKSYLAAVIVEELMKANNRACVLIVDPHAEYDTLSEMRGNPAFRGDDGYEPVVKVLRPSDIHVRFSTLRIGDLRYLLDITDRMEYVLERAYRTVQKRAREESSFSDHWTPEDLIGEASKFAAQRREEDESVDLRSSAAALEWRIQQLVSSAQILDANRHLDLRALFQPGQCTVLQLDEVDRREQQVAVAVLLRRLYQARQDTERGRAEKGSETYLPYPVFVLMEEAHHFAPGGDGGARVVSAEILRTILAEGRKFGVGIGLISQRPGKLDQDVLSQCMTQVMLRIVNPIDQNNVAAAVEGASRDVLDELPALSKGQAIIVGSSVNAPVLVAVRERHTPHGGQDQDAPRIWVEYSNPARQAERDRDTAPLAGPAIDPPLFESPNHRPHSPKRNLSFEDLFGPEPGTI
ncbi:MAG TPA: ATP-binding protein [Chloroflexota bacterium]|nr:ATP-binding protein [Chloroflexota bacterium]